MDCFFDTQIKGIADDGVTDGDFVKERYALFEVGEIQQVEVVAGVESESEAVGHIGGLYVFLDGGLAVGGVVGGVGLSVKLNTVGAGGLGFLDKLGNGVDKDGDTYAEAVEVGYYIFQKVKVFHRVPAGVGSEHILSVGDEGYLRGTHLGNKEWGCPRC